MPRTYTVVPKRPPDWLFTKIIPQLRYDPMHGEIYWRVEALNAHKSPLALGHLAGRPSRSETTFVHPFHNPSTNESHTVAMKHLAWYFIYGVWPARQITVLDEDQRNLRKANLQQAGKVKHKITIYRSTRKGRTNDYWTARTYIDGKLINLASNADKDECMRLANIKLMSKLLVRMRTKKA